MKLNKNPETNKLVITLVVCAVIFVALALAMTFFSMRYFQTAVYRNNAAVVGVVAEKYPAAEQDAIREMLEEDKDAVEKGQTVLARYGIGDRDLQLDTVVMRDILRVSMAAFVGLTVLICGTFTLIILQFQKKQYNQVREISSYARNIKSGDYSLDIRDNHEGEVSILKNEIYKITTMLNEQARALQKDKTALADSLADISHQLKTPMTSLFVLTDLMEENPAPEVRGEFLNKMRAQLDRIEWLVSSLLKLSKLDAGTAVLKREKVRVSELVDAALKAMEIPLDIKMQRVGVKGEEDAVFTGDFNWSVEALVNILKNCVEHTPEKGVISISYEENPLYTLIAVSDNGAGIDKEDLPYIFYRFYKGKNAGENSVGIGLAMAQAIVAEQGGDITVRSEPGRGTEFIIKIYKQ